MRRPVFTDGTTTYQFITFARLSIAEWKKARVTLVLEGSSGNLTAATAAIYSNTEAGFTSASAGDFPTSASTRTADGVAYGASYGTFDVTYQDVEVGVQVKNTTGTKRQMGTVTLVIDLSEE